MRLLKTHRSVLRSLIRPRRVAFLFLAAGAIFVMTCWHGCRTRGHDVWMSVAASNVHMLRMCLLIYAGEHDENFPATWSQLLAGVDRMPLDMFVCRPIENAPGAPSDVDNWAEYTLVPGRQREDPEDAVVAFCKVSHWKRHGGAFVISVEGYDFYPTDKMVSITNTLRVPPR